MTFVGQRIYVLAWLYKAESMMRYVAVALKEHVVCVQIIRILDVTVVGI